MRIQATATILSAKGASQEGCMFEDGMPPGKISNSTTSKWPFPSIQGVPVGYLEFTYTFMCKFKVVYNNMFIFIIKIHATCCYIPIPPTRISSPCTKHAP